MKYLSALATLAVLLLPVLAGCVPAPSSPPGPAGREARWKIKNGRLYVDGKWKFLKIAKPLRNFADPRQVDQLIGNLDLLKSKGYNTVALNCYWHHFDRDGDGTPDYATAPLQKLVNAISEKGMFPTLSVETYAVGGGSIPEGFWERHPDAYAINAKGEKVTDTEYGFHTKVISIFHPGYRAAVHAFIKNLAKAVDTGKILYFETTVEPQYMGEIDLCYSENARKAYRQWLADNRIGEPAARIPDSFPVPEAFIANPYWNKFRAQFLAKWVNEDASAYREIAGRQALVAVDFLDATTNTEQRRCGDPVEFLRALTAPDIIQVNWHWHLVDNRPNQKAYDRVRQVMGETKRNWAISEHMTFNGSDFVQHDEERLREILRNTLRQGTRFGWEFVNADNRTADNFSLYNDDWSPKKVIRVVDDHWNEWLKEINK